MDQPEIVSFSPIHIPAHGIGAVGTDHGDGVGQAGAALGDAGIGVGVAEMEGAGRMGNRPRRRGSAAGGSCG